MIKHSLHLSLAALVCVSCGVSGGSEPDSGSGSGSDVDAGPNADAAPELQPGDIRFQVATFLVAQSPMAFDDQGVAYLHGKPSYLAPDEIEIESAIAIDPSGAKIWSHNPVHGLANTPAITIADGVVYIPTAVDVDDFETSIHRFVGDAALEPLAFDGSLRFGVTVAEDGRLFAAGTSLHGFSDDQALWPPFEFTDLSNPGLSPRVGSQPVTASDGTIFVGARGADRNLYAVNPDGSERWRASWGGGNAADPAPQRFFADPSPGGFVDPFSSRGTRVYTHNTSHIVIAFESDGEVAWWFPSPGSPTASVVTDGGVCFGSIVPGSGSVVCVNETDGGQQAELKWQVDVVGGVLESPAVSSGGTLYHSACGIFFARDAETGAEKWRYEIAPNLCSTWSAAKIASDGSVYVNVFDPGEGAKAGRLIVFEGDGTGPARGWSSAGGDSANRNRAIP